MKKLKRKNCTQCFYYKRKKAQMMIYMPSDMPYIPASNYIAEVCTYHPTWEELDNGKNHVCAHCKLLPKSLRNFKEGEDGNNDLR
jgi:hypothetical protein